MPFQNHLQYDKQWEVMIPMIICVFLRITSQIDVLIHLMMFWNPLMSRDENWEPLYIDIHIDREQSDQVNPMPGRSPMSATLQYVRNQRSHPPTPCEQNEETSDSKNVPEESVQSQNLADPGVVIPGPPTYQSSQTFNTELNIWEVPMPETLRAIFQSPQVCRPVTVFPDGSATGLTAPWTYKFWSNYFRHMQEESEAGPSRGHLEPTQPLHVHPRPRPFTPHPDLVESSTLEHEEQMSDSTEPITPDHPTTPLEKNKDDMHRLHPTLPLNTELEAAVNNSIELTEMQHNILTSQSEGSTTLYHKRDDQQQVEGVEGYSQYTIGEMRAIGDVQDALQMGMDLEGMGAGINSEQEPRIADLVHPNNPPILHALMQELDGNAYQGIPVEQTSSL